MDLNATITLYGGGPGSGRHAYHVTPASNVKSILKTGIMPSKGNHGKGVYAFTSHDEARGYFGSFGHPDGSAVVEVKDRGGFREVSHGALISERKIPKRDIVAVHLYDGAHKANFVKTIKPGK